MKIDEVESIVENALREDLPAGDITSESIVPPESSSEAVILAREAGILAGIEVAGLVFRKIDASIIFEKLFEDGQEFSAGDILARIKGNSRSLLKGERTALNFLQRMSGIATKTREFVRVLRGTKTKILDTRKTTPGLRILEKYAVKTGGGENHRANLSEMVLIKDNHLRLTGSISKAVHLARDRVKKGVKIEVEVNNLEGVKEALRAGADIIMLDNMGVEEIKKAVTWVNRIVPVEVSGKLDREKVKQLASLGIDYLSVGSLTHSYQSLDISLEFSGE